jgi:radical SAM C-methyltransferase
MSLAASYLKATAMADPLISESVQIEILNYRGGLTVSAMANDMFSHGAPDMLAFSLFGWNFRAVGKLAEAFKQINRDGVVIFGGTHVANHAERTFAMFPDVDVVVNGRGQPWIARRSQFNAHDISGRYRRRYACEEELEPFGCFTSY